MLTRRIYNRNKPGRKSEQGIDWGAPENLGKPSIDLFNEMQDRREDERFLDDPEEFGGEPTEELNYGDEETEDAGEAEGDEAEG